MISKNLNIQKPANMSNNSNNKKLKVVTIIGTRPEIIKLSEVIKKCDQYFDHILIHTDQNWDYNLNKVFFENFELRSPDYCLEAVGADLGETMGSVIAKSYTLLKELAPDALLLLGDTNSALAAISAKRLKIPIFHMEAGNRCFDQNVPEEINRKIIDHISDVNLPYTEHARRYLLNEGLNPAHIFTTGSPMPEVLLANKSKITSNKILDKLNLSPNNYFVLSTHREENVDSEISFNKLITSANAIAEHYNNPIIFSVHPRTQIWLDQRKPELHNLIQPVKPFGLFDYIKLQQNAFCVISDSGTLSEESNILGFPGVLIRTSTERPESIDTGGTIIGGIDSENIINSINMAVNTFAIDGLYKIPEAYRDTNVSTKVIKIIQSYTSIINHFVWRKENQK